MAKHPEPTVGNEDLPALFQAADRASSRAQNLYLKLVGFDLGVMVCGAMFGAFSVTSENLRQELALASAVSIAISLALTLALKAEHLSATWYDGRAVAESAKTTAWRYMMCAQPYTRDLSEADADRTLTAALDSFLRERKGLAGSLSALIAALPQITGTMRAVRALPLADRKSIYLRARVGDQRVWYANKAERNAKKSARLIFFILGCQALALVAAINLVRWPDARFNLTGVFAALAAALIAWTQLKKHEELATVYGLTAQELSSVEDEARHLASEETFSGFVLDAENAIAREHTLWLARRDRY